jgi:hypothetical protein
MNEKRTTVACKVVFWPQVITANDPVQVEVTAREFEDVKCGTCGQEQSSFDERAEAAYQDGRTFGDMLRQHGSSEYKRGLLEVLKP